MPITRRRTFPLAVGLLLGAAWVAPARAEQVVRVGIMAGEDEDVWAVVAEQAKLRGLALKIVTFNDYTLPNEALEHGDIDANAFQHKPYLENQVKQRGYHIVPAGLTALFPIGVYSHKHHSIAELPQGAVIGVPNDPSNEGRALLVLQSEGLIKLRPGAGVLATAIDVAESAKGVQLRELDAGMVGRAIDDLDAAVVNNDWAAKAGLTPKDRIASEARENNPYANFIAVRAADQDKPWVKALVASFQNDTVKQELVKAWRGTAVPAWQ